MFDAPIVHTTPVQAELAKIWANILRYTHVRAAQPLDDGLRAPRRQRVRGDRPRQPRLPPRRPRPAGVHRGDLPAQGLRLLRGALPRARDAARGLACQRVRAAVPRRRDAPAPGHARQPQGRRARPRLQGRHRRRARLARAQARCGCSSASWPTSPCTTPTSPPPPRRWRRCSRAPTRWSWPPTTPSSASPRRSPRSPRSPPRSAWWWTPGTAGARGRCSRTPPSLQRWRLDRRSSPRAVVASPRRARTRSWRQPLSARGRPPALRP